MEPEVDCPGAGPVAPRGLQHLRLEAPPGGSVVQRLEAQHDEGALQGGNSIDFEDFETSLRRISGTTNVPGDGINYDLDMD